jgi:hypothetical protein
MSWDDLVNDWDFFLLIVLLILINNKNIIHRAF